MLTKAIITHIFEDIVPCIKHEDYWIKDLEIIENENNVSIPLYCAKLTNGNDQIKLLLCSLDDGNINVIKTNSDLFWILSSLDESFDFKCIQSNSEYNCSIKQQAQFLLSWESLVDAGWSWGTNKEDHEDLFAILEKYIER